MLVRNVFGEFVENFGSLRVYRGNLIERRLALQRSFSREHLVENGAKSKDVTAGVHLFTL
jgi:hypothetical protein